MMTLREYARSTKFFIVAHRAGAGDSIELENSQTSIANALQFGMKTIEIDLVACQDEIIAYHDEFIEVGGKQIQIENQAFAEISKLKSGILNLDKVLDLLKGKSYLVLELKESCTNTINTILEKVIAAEMLQHTIFVSFYPQILNTIKTTVPTSLVGFIAEPDKGIMPSAVIKQIDFDLFINDINEMNASIANDAKSIGMPFACYGVNTKEDLEKALQLGASSVGTDYPERLIEAMPN